MSHSDRCPGYAGKQRSNWNPFPLELALISITMTTWEAAFGLSKTSLFVVKGMSASVFLQY